jgi:hypothetical protein
MVPTRPRHRRADGFDRGNVEFRLGAGRSRPLVVDGAGKLLQVARQVGPDAGDRQQVVVRRVDAAALRVDAVADLPAPMSYKDRMCATCWT